MRCGSNNVVFGENSVKKLRRLFQSPLFGVITSYKNEALTFILATCREESLSQGSPAGASGQAFGRAERKTSASYFHAIIRELHKV